MVPYEHDEIAGRSQTDRGERQVAMGGPVGGEAEPAMFARRRRRRRDEPGVRRHHQQAVQQPAATARVLPAFAEEIPGAGQGVDAKQLGGLHRTEHFGATDRGQARLRRAVRSRSSRCDESSRASGSHCCARPRRHAPAACRSVRAQTTSQQAGAPWWPQLSHRCYQASRRATDRGSVSVRKRSSRNQKCSPKPMR